MKFPSPSDPSAATRLGVCAGVGVIAAVVAELLGGGKLAPLGGWDTAAAIYLVWMWLTIWPLGASESARRSAREEPNRVIADAVLLSAAVTSLVAVGVILIESAHKQGTAKNLLVALAIVSVVLAWGVVHTVFTLRYTRLYYGGTPGGISFNESASPRYSDFAYLAFTIGMTFQVSDTNLQTQDIRATALRHALVSYVFGAVIIATTINLIAGLTK